MQVALHLLPPIIFIALVFSGLRKTKKNLCIQICALGLFAMVFICGDLLNEFLFRKFALTGNVRFSLSVFLVAVAAAFLIRFNGFREALKQLPMAFFISAICWCVLKFIEGEHFGALTDSFLGWQYSAGQPAHTFQVAAGLIDFTSVRALPVHPVQLYAAILFAACAIVYRWIRKMKFRLTALLLSSFSFVFCVQFFLSFFTSGSCRSVTEPGHGQLLLLLYWCNAAVALCVFGTVSIRYRTQWENTILPYLFAGASCLVMFFAPDSHLGIIICFQLAVLVIALHKRFSSAPEQKKTRLTA